METSGHFLALLGNTAGLFPNLTDATGKRHPEVITWTAQMKREFQDLMGALSNDTILVAHCPNLPLVLHTDTSDRRVRATLSHVIDGVEKPVAFFSKKMLP